MTPMNAATKQTAPFIVYKQLVLAQTGLSVALLDQFRTRLGQAFDMGEPVWMIADEIKLRVAAPRKHKTPKQLAASFTVAAR